MSRNRFEILLLNVSYIFQNNENAIPGDRLAQIKFLLDFLAAKYQNVVVPGKNYLIDETFASWRGRRVFRQYSTCLIRCISIELNFLSCGPQKDIHGQAKSILERIEKEL